jgi:hypothetical protein
MTDLTKSTSITDAAGKKVPAAFATFIMGGVIYRVLGEHKVSGAKRAHCAGLQWAFRLDGTAPDIGLTLNPPEPEQPDILALIAALPADQHDAAQAALDAARAKGADPVDWDGAACAGRRVYLVTNNPDRHKDWLAVMRAARPYLTKGMVRMPEIDVEAIADTVAEECWTHSPPSIALAAIREVLRQIEAFNAGDEA